MAPASSCVRSWRAQIRLVILCGSFLCVIAVAVIQHSLHQHEYRLTNNPVSTPSANWSNESNSQNTSPQMPFERQNTEQANFTPNLDAASQILDAQTVTAVLPMSNSVLPALADTLAALYQNYPLVSVTLLVSESGTVALRREVHKLMDEELWSDANLSLMLQVREGSIVEDILSASAQAYGDIVLVLDEKLAMPHGLEASDGPLPVGLRGHVRGSCVVPSATEQPVDYLEPPLIMKASLARELEVYNVLSWSALGSSIAKRYDAGGTVSASQAEFRDDDWCSPRIHDRPNTAYCSALDSNAFAFDSMDPAPGFHTINASADHGRFGIILPSISSLRDFSPVICNMLTAGHTVNVLLQTSTGVVPGRVEMLETDVCDIPYIVSRSYKDMSMWVECSVLDVLISVMDYFPTSIMEHGRFALIRLPRNDLLYCDWMGTLSLQEWKSWNIPRIELSIITDSRPTSLARLVHSLTAARYFGDTVSLRVNLEQSANTRTRAIVDHLSPQWTRGPLFVHHRVVQGGLLSAVVESWYPSSNDSYGILLEDDVEVSPLFFAWAKQSILRYRYGPERANTASLFGVSLYSPKNLELRPSGRVSFDSHAVLSAAGYPPDAPYLSQVPCSWGAVYFPEHWREFHAYLPLRLRAPTAIDVVPGARSNRWARSWKRYFIELAFVRGYAMLYPNFAGGAALSTNHLEQGAHVKPLPPPEWARKKALFEVPLVPLPRAGARTELLDVSGAAGLPRWEDMPLLDLFGELVEWDVVRERGAQRRLEVWGCNSTGDPFDANNLMCV